MRYFHCIMSIRVQWFMVGAMFLLAFCTVWLRGEDKPKLAISLRTNIVRMVPGDKIRLEHFTDAEFKREEVGDISYEITQLSYYHRKGGKQIFLKNGRWAHTSIGDEFSGLNGVIAATSGGLRWDYSDEKRVGFKVEATALRLGTYLIQAEWALRRRDKDGRLAFERVRSDPAIVFVELPLVNGVPQVDVASRPETMSGSTLQWQELLEEEFPNE